MKRLLPAFLLFLAMPVSSWAACCEGRAISAIERAESALTSRITAMQASVVMQLKMNAADEIATTETLRKSLLEALGALTQEMETYNQEIAKRVEQYKTEKELDRTYGLSDATRQVICDEANRAQTAAQNRTKSIAASGSVRTSVRDGWVSADPSKSKASQVAGRIVTVAGVKEDLLDVRKIYDGSTKDEDVTLLSSMLVDPDPPSAMPAETSVQGVLYQKDNKERLMRQSAVLGVVTEALEKMRPDKETGLSHVQILDEAIQNTGFLSKPYRAAIQTAERPELLRQVLLQYLVQNQLLVDRYEMLINRSVMIASTHAQELDGHMRTKLAEAKSRMSRQ